MPSWRHALLRFWGLIGRLLTQQPKDKLYSLHAPKVVCIAKGKAHSSALTNSVVTDSGR